MIILLIGKSGKLGNILYNDLKNHHKVIALTRQEFDIFNTEHFECLIDEYDFDIVINTAAFNDLPYCEIYPTLAFQHNCFAVENMAKICNRYNIVFITFSTNYVFNGKSNIPYIETDIPFPIQMYGLSKLAGEYTSLKYENTIVIRTTGLFGIHNCFINNRIKESDDQDSIEISNDQSMSFTYTNDLSKAIIQLINHPNREYGIYHLINKGYCTWYEFTKEAFKLLNINTILIPVNRGENYKLLDGNMRRPLFAGLKNTKAKKLGIELPTWENAIERYLNESRN
jgi:dTDP-4-dehydrorhamnose reductase